MKMRLALFGATALAAATTPAFAGVDMNAVAAMAAQPIAQGQGSNTVETSRNADGSTMINVTLPGGFRYLLINDVCQAGSCNRLGFVVVYSPSAGDYSPDTLNEWNASRPPQAFKADGSTVMIHYVLAPDGITAGNLRMNFDFWNDSLLSFNNFLANAPKGVAVKVSASMSEKAPGHPEGLPTALFEHGAMENAANPKLMLPE